MVNKNGQNCVKDGVTNRYPILPLLLPASCNQERSRKTKRGAQIGHPLIGGNK